MIFWNAAKLEDRSRDGLTRLAISEIADTLGHPADSVTITTPSTFPGPLDILTRDGQRLSTVSGWTPAIAWARDPMILTVWMDGTPGYDYSAKPTTREETENLPAWVFDSLNTAGPAFSGRLTLAAFQKFADRWELEWIDPVDVPARLAGHFIDDVPGTSTAWGKEASDALRAIRDDLPETL